MDPGSTSNANIEGHWSRAKQVCRWSPAGGGADGGRADLLATCKTQKQQCEPNVAKDVMEAQKLGLPQGKTECWLFLGGGREGGGLGARTERGPSSLQPFFKKIKIRRELGAPGAPFRWSCQDMSNKDPVRARKQRPGVAGGRFSLPSGQLARQPRAPRGEAARSTPTKSST